MKVPSSLALLLPLAVPSLAARDGSIRGRSREHRPRITAEGLFWTDADAAVPAVPLRDRDRRSDDDDPPAKKRSGVEGRYIVTLEPEAVAGQIAGPAAIVAGGGAGGGGGGGGSPPSPGKKPSREDLEAAADALLGRLSVPIAGGAALGADLGGALFDPTAAQAEVPPPSPARRVGSAWTLISGFAAELSADQAASLADTEGVARVEPDGIVEKHEVGSWGLDRIDQRDLPLNDEYLPSASGAYLGGLGVKAYIIDTGIRITHTEFQGRASWGANYADDKDFDCNDHGTHVAGTVGGKTYGVAKDVELIAVKVLDCDGSGTYSGVISGINWVAEDCKDGERCVANMSLGGGKSDSVNNAVNAAVDAGVVFAVSAGNSNKDAKDYSPASAEKALTVGATDDNDGRSSFSNFGSVVDLFAPGRDIKSALAGSDTQTASYSGTSMSCPHVCGAAALLWAREPSLDAIEVSSRIVDEATVGKVIDPKGDNLLLYVEQGTATPTSPPTTAAPTPIPPPSTASPTRDEATTAGFDISNNSGFTPRLVGSDISQSETLYVRIFCPGPNTVAPGYGGKRVDWTDLRKAEWELKLNGSERMYKTNLQNLGNGYYLGVFDGLANVPLGFYEVKLKIEDNSGVKLEYKDDTQPASFITVVEAVSAPPPTASPTTAYPTASPSKAPTGAPTTAAPSQPPTAPVPATPGPTSAPTRPPTSAPSISPTTGRPTSAPTRPPTAAPVPPSSCALPTSGEFVVITTDGCTDSRNRDTDVPEVNLSDKLTMILHSDDVDEARIRKIEIEFKVEGNTDRKTKFKLELDKTPGFDENSDFYHSDNTLPYAIVENGVVYYKLEVDVNKIGDIGGNANGDDNWPVEVGESIFWKFKVEDLGGKKGEYRDLPPIEVVGN